MTDQSPLFPLPCPFCGREKLKVNVGYRISWVECLRTKCEAHGPNSLAGADGAVRKWNAAKRGRMKA